MPTDRRAFLHTLGAAALAAGLDRARVGPLPRPAATLDRIGLQLYTVRGALERDFEGTLDRVAAIGYREVEFAGYYGKTPHEVWVALEKRGLAAPSAHVPFETLKGNWRGALEDARVVGHRYVVVPWIPPDERRSLDGYKRVARLFNRAGAVARELGLQFAYHNQAFEFARLGGRVPYDVLLAGSGAGGGMAASVLTQAGADVIVLEAGGPWDNTKDSAMLTWPYDTARRGASSRERPFGEFDACIGGWDIEGEPYTRAPGTRFDWWRARMVGGRTNHWGRISLRFGPRDFRHKSVDGLGDDWPIGYDDVKPYYDRVDRLVGIFGSKEGLPNEPDGIFLPPPRPRCYELVVKQACDRLAITCIPSRLSILTRPLHGRPACHYCGQCNRGCRSNSNFTSTNVLIAPALATGKLTLVTNAMAREVTLDKSGRVTGVAYVDKIDGSDRHARARVVVLAASACESARLLLNSKSSLFPNGLANSSGVAGKYLTDTTGTDMAECTPPPTHRGAPHEDGGGGKCPCRSTVAG